MRLALTSGFLKAAGIPMGLADDVLKVVLQGVPRPDEKKPKKILPKVAGFVGDLRTLRRETRGLAKPTFEGGAGALQGVLERRHGHLPRRQKLIDKAVGLKAGGKPPAV